MYQWLHAKIISSILRFKSIIVAYKQKLYGLYKQCKDDKLVNNISRNDWYKCKFYESMDKWWHFNENAMKHVSASANDFAPTPPLESSKIIMDLKNDTMDFSKDSFKKNPTNIDVFSYIQAMTKNSR